MESFSFLIKVIEKRNKFKNDPIKFGKRFDSQMKQGEIGEGILKIILSIVGMGVLLVCITGVLSSLYEWGKLEWFLGGIGIASVFWYVYHLKYADPNRYEAIMKELKGRKGKQKDIE